MNGKLCFQITQALFSIEIWMPLNSWFNIFLHINSQNWNWFVYVFRILKLSKLIKSTIFVLWQILCKCSFSLYSLPFTQQNIVLNQSLTKFRSSLHIWQMYVPDSSACNYAATIRPEQLYSDNGNRSVIGYKRQMSSD